MYGSIKNHIVTAVQKVLLAPLEEQFTGFRKVTALQMLHNLFNSYRVMDKIDLEENAVKTMGSYNPADPLDWLIKKL